MLPNSKFFQFLYPISQFLVPISYFPFPISHFPPPNPLHCPSPPETPPTIHGPRTTAYGPRTTDYKLRIPVYYDHLDAGRGIRMSDRLPASKHEKPNGVLDVFPGSFWSMPSPLPAPLTPLIGREAEAAMVADMLTSADVRLVTLIGPGGIGKTRLAFQLGADLAETTFTDGVTFVEFSTVRSPNLVVPTIGSALGLRPDNAHSPIDALLSVLRHRQMLLVLDNFEQVVDSGPDLTAVLRYCPEITMLVTSRTRLRIAAEHVVPVAPLAVPLNPNAVEPAHSPDQLSEIAAVRLFVQRARAVEPAFLLTERNASAVAAIVQRLDGLPLAIELAAARIPIFPPSELLERLEPRLPQLTGGPRDDPPRHQTMRDSIAWSYDLLTPVEQAVFRCLSVLTGGGSLAAAEAICEGQQSDPAPIVASGIRELLRPEASSDTDARTPTLRCSTSSSR